MRNAPNKFGINPQAAERLRAFGIDAEELSQQIKQQAHGNRAERRARLSYAANLTGQIKREALNALKLTLDPNDVRVTPLLNNAALMYENNNYIADVLAPVQSVTERSAKYKIWDRGPFRSLIDSKIGPTGTAKEVSPTLSEDNYSVQDRALRTFVPRDTELANPSLRLGIAQMNQVMELHYLMREYDIATLFATSGSYAGANVKALTTGSGGTNWKQGSGAKPIADMLSMMEVIPGDVTHATCSDVVWHTIQQVTELKNILASQLSNEGLLRPMDFQLYFGIPNMLITKADYRNDSGARKRLWSETDLFLTSVNPGMDQRTFCRTFRLSQGAGGWVTDRYEDPERRGVNGGTFIKVAYTEDRKIVSNDYGVLIQNVVG